MLTGPRHALSAATVLLFAGPNVLTLAQMTRSPSASTASSTVKDPSTCPFRSLNYITQTLPQQCLTTSWTSKPGTQNATTRDVDVQPATSSTLGINTTGSMTTQKIPEECSSKGSASFINASFTTTQSENVPTSSTSASVGVKQGHLPESEGDMEIESPLDNANFLTFEDWKRQNLAKAGQSPENLGNRGGIGGAEPRRRPGSINNALDSLGEESEIDIDFGGFVNPGVMTASVSAQDASIQHEAMPVTAGEMQEKGAEDVTGAHRKGKDAGKTCKERSNYASFDCAATMLKTNPECKGSSAVLVENKDNYMLNTCSAQNKFFIVELCDDILIDTVVLANFEFFSSMFRTFRVSVSDRFPVKLDKWRDLGTFEARNSREIQAFLIETPLIWARYIRIEFLTHFGNEYYCPLSLIRVHGTTMMEEFNHDVKGSRSDDDFDGEPEEEAGSVPNLSSEKGQEEHSKSAQSEETVTMVASTTTSSAASAGTNAPTQGQDIITTTKSHTASPGFSPKVSSRNTSPNDVMLLFVDNRTYICHPKDRLSEPLLSLGDTPGTESQNIKDPRSASLNTAGETTSRTIATKSINSTTAPQHSTTAAIAVSIPHISPNATDSSSQAVVQSSVNVAKVQPSHTQPPASSPTTQESFFKSVHKRLQLLEANSTLSLQYIEEQSRILRDAFSKVEKRQVAKTSSFLETLNTTVLTELRDFRMQYDQIWQSTVLELSSQREQSQHEVFALSARLGLLAEQIIFQQRMAIVQFLLILLCLGLVIFSRHSNYLELPPRVQNAINKSSVNLSRYATSFETPPASPSSRRPSTRNGLFRSWTHYRSPSEESAGNEGAKSPMIEYSPPTPETLRSGDSGGGSPSHEASGNSSDSLLEAEHGRQTKSSPATPSGKRGERREFVEGALLHSH